ncbi:AAEL000387-PA [Aedes aegypti]|uniref:AAEL000387-PA n=1 Tax=Aedes aegypti TaxID=7159 RepID=Q0IGG3_AEDAE|nr:AAEL000387-PA [Aedes aegypti]
MEAHYDSSNSAKHNQYLSSYENGKFGKEVFWHHYRCVAFPVHANIELVNVKIDYFSPEVVQRMRWVSKLTISQGSVSKIFLKDDLQELIATSSLTHDVIIGETENEELERLTITQNQLESIPKNVEKLKTLTVLDLSYNKIEVVDLDELNGLGKLTYVDLSSNRIYYLTAVNSFELPRLETFKLDNNYLMEIDFDAWTMPSLTTLSIMSNSLKYIKDFKTENFPSLRTYQDYSNLFDCRWRAGFISMLQAWEQLENYYYQAQDCHKSVQLSAAVYRMLNIRDIRNNTIDLEDKEQLQSQLTTMLDTEQKQSRHIESLTKLVKEQTEQLEAVSTELQAQQTTIDGLLSQIEELKQLVAEIKQSAVPTGRTVPKGLRARMIQEIEEVIRRNLVEVED